MRRILVVAAVITLGVSMWASRALSGQDNASGSRSVRITSTGVSSGVVTVRVRINGWRMYPGRVGGRPSPDGGHWAIYVNGRFNARSTSPTVGRTKRLADGRYSIRAVLVNNDDSLLRPAVRSGTVSIRIGAESPPPETTE